MALPPLPPPLFFRASLSSSVPLLLRGVAAYFVALSFFLCGARYHAAPLLAGFPTRTRVHLYFLALNFWLWRRAHYRAGSHQEDLLKNLRNVAIPGTGLPLHLFATSRLAALLFLGWFYPLLATVGAVHRFRVEYKARLRTAPPLAEQFGTLVALLLEHLLAPEDWFTYWRMNSALASYHSLLSGAEGYRFENKWDFLRDGAALGVPVSPLMDVSDIVVKDRNEEGGMGIYFFRNATEGGDWIIQRRLRNAESVERLLPPNAPLSTFRVMTASSWSSQASGARADRVAADCVSAMSCVFRAGRSGASTDHSSVLFDVDVATGMLKRGTTNDHWYQLGLRKALWCPWLSFHDQTGSEGVVVTGKALPGCKAMLAMCVESHYQMLKDVPLVGWDVAVCAPPDEGQWLLEVNLSCNFFRGSFDSDAYFAFLDRYLVALEPLKLRDQDPKKTA